MGVLVALFQALVFLHARSLADEAEDKMKAPVYRIVRNTHCGIIINVASKYVDPQMLQQAFLKSFELIDVCSIDSDDIKRSAELNWADFGDCLISIAAEKVKADAIVTRDPKGFEGASMAVLSPDQVLAMLENKYGVSYDGIEF